MTTVFYAQCKCLKNMVLAMGEAMIFVVDSDEAVGQCDDEDMRKLEALAANKNDETAVLHSMSFREFLTVSSDTCSPRNSDRKYFLYFCNFVTFSYL